MHIPHYVPWNILSHYVPVTTSHRHDNYLWVHSGTGITVHIFCASIQIELVSLEICDNIYFSYLVFRTVIENEEEQSDMRSSSSPPCLVRLRARTEGSKAMGLESTDIGSH